MPAVLAEMSLRDFGEAKNEGLIYHLFVVLNHLFN
jgi:hypothetical protein